MKAIKITSLLTLGILLILLVVQNTAPVQARLLWFEAELPVIVLLLVVAIGAFVSGVLVTMLRGRKKRSGKLGSRKGGFKSPGSDKGAAGSQPSDRMKHETPPPRGE